MTQPECPVDHSSSSQPAESCPVDPSTRSVWSRLSSASAPTPSVQPPSQLATESCPVDHSNRSIWSRIFSSAPTTIPSPAPPGSALSSSRVISTIPRHDLAPNDAPGSDPSQRNWVYPSEAQFFRAMAMKNHGPQEADMKTIVPIHNAVNERAWAHILEWEDGRGAESCGGPRLVNFQGKPQERTPKARWKILLGYGPCPFKTLSHPIDFDLTKVYRPVRQA